MGNLKVFNDHEHYRWKQKHNENTLANFFNFLGDVWLFSFTGSQVNEEVNFLQTDYSRTSFEKQTNLATVVAINDNWNDNY